MDAARDHRYVISPDRPGAAHRNVDLALLAVAVAWGSSYLAAKDVVTAEGVFAFLVIRFALAAVGLSIVLAPRLRGMTRAEVALGAPLGAILSVVLLLETFGVTRTSAANAGLIISLTVVMTPLLDRRRDRRPLPGAFYVASAVAVAGVALLTQSGGFARPGLGDGLILLAAFARSVHVTVMAHLPRGRPHDTARVTVVQLFVALGIFAGFAPFVGRGVDEVLVALSVRSWVLLVHLAGVCTVFAFVVQMWAVRRTSPSRVSLLLGTEPLWAAAFGVGLAGDRITIVSILGALLILLGTEWARRIDAYASVPLEPAPTSPSA